MDDANENAKEGALIQELITHLNQLESKITALEEKLSETADLQMVSKLDIINLRNELEKTQFLVPAAKTPPGETRAPPELQSMSKRLDDATESLQEVTRRLQSLETQATPGRQRWQGGGQQQLAEEVAQLRKEIRPLGGMEAELARLKAASQRSQPDASIRIVLERHDKLLAALQSGRRGSHPPEQSSRGHSKELADLRKSIASLAADTARLNAARRQSPDALTALQREVDQVRKAVDTKTEAAKKEAISFVLRELKKMVS